MPEYVLAEEGTIRHGDVRRMVAGAATLCVGRIDSGEYFAIADECTHEEIELSDGDLEGCEIECPAHGSRFNVMTGEVRGLPAVVPVKVYPISLSNGSIVVSVD
jgi:3-phenylpropionate/trans-cinnamate dioxygenase ferredoxin component